ncbi:MAG: hypothetical protein PHQ91_04720 [Thermoanaerobaculaceae bacterium]|nr:hypothetical protein [Thermoanaerobaculaceae bacterium]TAM54998.1 MAG: hypothetical protein EPN53_03490 [Acidobacteriota bacterium]
MIELSTQMVMYLLAAVGILLLLLVVSLLSRPRVFTQYLEAMTGIKLSARDVARVYKQRGKSGVRDMFLELIIREDLKSGPRITPDSAPDLESLVPEPRK